MQFIGQDIVVFGSWAAVAAEYRDHAPRRGDFSLPLPYRTIKTDAITVVNTAMDSPAGANGSDGGAVAATATATAANGTGRLAASQPAAGSSARQTRKRKQSSSYQPNERELEAAARHAAVAPQLAAAAAAVQEWVRASGAATVQQALLMVDSAPGRQQRTGSAGAQAAAGCAAAAGAAAVPSLEPAAAVTGDGAVEPAAAEQPPADGAALEPDYRAMFELRHTLKPKLQFAHCAAAPAAAHAAAGAAAGAAGLAAAGAAQGRGGTGASAACATTCTQDVQQLPAVILFNRLISSEGDLGACGSGSSEASGSSSRSSKARGGSRGGSGRAERLAWAGGHPVLLPPRSRFLMSDARQLSPLVSDAQESGGYHCILLDPPWENASAKRSARYPTLPSRNLLGLPLRQLMCQSGCLVAIWITNRERHRRFIDAELLPGWGLRHLATWHWLKVTDRGQLVSRLDVEHRRPYESLLLCWPAHLPPPPGLPASGQRQHCGCADGQEAAAGAAAGAAAAHMIHGQAGGAAAAAAEAATEAGGRTAPQAGPRSSSPPPSAAGSGFHLLAGRRLVVAAVPHAAHSRKPHLGPLLLPLLPPGARCLEMFARELHAGWTSWGNEALKFQSTSYFEHL